MKNIYQDVFGITPEMMHGKGSRSTQMWMISQGGKGNALTSFVGACRNDILSFDAKEPHTLIVGRLIVIPDLVMASRHLIGSGAAGLLTGGANPAEWAANGRLIYQRGQ